MLRNTLFIFACLVIVASVVVGLYFREEIMSENLMVKSLPELLAAYEQTTDSTDRLNLAMAVVVAEVRNATAEVINATREVSDLMTEEGEAKYTPLEVSPPLTENQKEILDDAKAHLKWASDTVGIYISKIPKEQMESIMARVRPELIEYGFKDDFDAQDMALSVQASFQKLPCTREDFLKLPAKFGAEKFIDLAPAILRANLDFSSMVSRGSSDAIFEAAKELAESQSHREIIEVFQSLVKTPSKLDRDQSQTAKDYPKWAEARELLMPFRHEAPHCFGSKNLSTFTAELRRFKTSIAAE